jgi:hypothetical protein
VLNRVFTIGFAVLVLTASTAEAQATWQLARTPEVSIGVAEGATENMLHRVAGGFRFPDGRIVVANGGTQEVRVYDARGRFLSGAGRRGEGPGEYTQLSRVFPFGDSILAYDFRLQRLSILSGDGKYARSFNMPRLRDGYSAQPVGTLSDGTIVVQATRQFMMGDSPHGVNRESAVLYRVSRTGQALDSIAAVAGWERYVRTVNVGGRTGFTVHALPFARMPAVAVRGDRVFVGASDRYEIDVYSRDGKRERRITYNQPNRKVTRADIDRFRTSRIASAAAQSDLYKQRTEEALREMQMPDVMPAYSTVHADSEGNLWVQDYRAEGETHTRWTVFDRNGRAIARVSGPDEFTVLDIGPDWIVGLSRDELEVEHVGLYRLKR